MSPPNTSARSPQPKFRIPPWLGWLIALTIVLAATAWIFLVADRDFYRPGKPLSCESPAPSLKPFHFIAYGDWGEGTAFQQELAKQLNTFYMHDPFPMVLLLGDNIYENGDIKKYAKTYFEEPYAPLLKAGVKFRAALGNHDVKDAHMADQIAYFKMPGEYYKFSQGPVDFFIINTMNFAIQRQQQQWLAKTLAESKAPWKIVAGHHPMYSSGRHGSTSWVKEKLEPMMIRNHVDLYLSGHDHDYERFKPIHGVHYIVAGGGGAFLTDFRKIQEYSLVHLRTHHFLSIEVAGRDIWVKAINRFGDVIDCVHWQKPLSNKTGTREPSPI
jgi:hypothetical protein